MTSVVVPGADEEDDDDSDDDGEKDDDNWWIKLCYSMIEFKFKIRMFDFTILIYPNCAC